MDSVLTYLTHWWQGALLAHYQPFGLTMSQFHKLVQLAQYFTGLLTIFEIVRITSVSGRLRALTILPVYVFRLLSLVLNSPNLILRFVLACYMALRGQKRFLVTAREALLEHLWAARTEAGMEAAALDQKLQNMPAERFLVWLETHLFSERMMRLLTFFAFALLSLAEILTDPF